MQDEASDRESRIDIYSNYLNLPSKDDILMEFSEIQRPSTVINKCISFINEIHPNDILVIPSARSSYITFALDGDYYE